MADTLQELQQRIASRKSLEAKLRELQDQKAEYDRKVISLHVAFREEQADVEKLEGRSLANYFFQVIGKMDEKLDRERQEAYAARVKLDGARQELAAVEEDMGRIQDELHRVRLAEAEYDQLLARKYMDLKSSHTPQSRRILELEEQIAALQACKKEIREAVSAGSGALGICDSILSELDSADNWNTWDLIGGSGIITHAVKHSHLDSAQDQIGELQRRLRRFKTELADIQITADTQVNVQGFLRFADYFFDGLFADWAVGERISQSKSSVAGTRNSVRKALDRLRAMEQDTDRQIAQLKEELDRFVVNA